MGSSSLGDRARVAALAALGLAGCSTLPGHRCAGGAQCGPNGRCEPIGVCAFPTSSCASGWAYGDDVFGDVDGTCTPVGDADGGGDATTSPCGARVTRLFDDFDVTGPGPDFTSSGDTNFAFAEVGGQLVIDVGPAPAAGTYAFGGYRSVLAFDLTDGLAEVDVADVGTVSRVFAYIQVQSHVDGFTRIEHSGTQVVVRIDIGGQPGQVAARAWNPAEHYWRIRASSGDMIWEVSADRASWLELHRAPVPFDISQATVKLAVATDASAGTQVRYESAAVCGP
ncbi:MAG: hypothetical protein IPH80_13010 [Myxococcales bacterium]|nr:hypothetical protein [Myxococcales bacterium]MBP6848186.1 hypothetical protein [Kofleriaceae bacterium]